MAEALVDPLPAAMAIVGFARALGTRLRERPDGTGLTLADVNVLAGIEKGYDLSSTLSRQLLLDPPRVSRVVETLVEAGYVAREVDKQDRRRSRLRLTVSGREQLERGRAELAGAMEELLAVLDGEERAGLAAAIPGMRRAMAGQRERVAE